MVVIYLSLFLLLWRAFDRLIPTSGAGWPSRAVSVSPFLKLRRQSGESNKD